MEKEGLRSDEERDYRSRDRMRPVDVLAIAAHPDDAELGCAGGLLLSAHRGRRTAVVDLSRGEMASRGTVEIRQDEARVAARILGLSERRNLGFPDTQIGADSSQLSAIVQLIRDLKPRLVLAPYPEDRHPDHVAAGVLVKKACFYSGLSQYGDGEPFRPERLFFYMLSYPFTPTFVMDISEVWALKMEALRAYRSQFSSEEDGIATPISHQGFLKLVEARAIWYGSLVGAEYGEPYYTPGPVAVDDYPNPGERSGSSERLLPPYTPFY